MTDIQIKWRTCVLFAGLCVSCILNSSLSAQTVIAKQPFRFQHFDTQNGLPSQFVRTIAQDSLGFMWFSGYGGLSRFDGHNFKVFKYDPEDTARSLPPGNVGVIDADVTGNIWVFMRNPSLNVQFAKYDSKMDRFVKYVFPVKASLVVDFCFDTKNPMIWFATDGSGLYSFNLETRETNHYFHERRDSLQRIRANRIFDLIDRDSCVLIGTAAGLWTFDKKSRKFGRPLCNPADSTLLFHTPIWGIDKGPNKDERDLWLWPTGRLLKVDENLSRVKSFKFPEGVIARTYAIDHEGVLWFPTHGQGLYRYDPEDDSFVNIRNIPGDETSLKHNNVGVVKVDRDQNIWMTTESGVSILPRQSLKFYNYDYPGIIDESMVYQENGKDFLVVGKLKQEHPHIPWREHEVLLSEIDHNRLDCLVFESIATFRGAQVHGLWKGKRHLLISIYELGIVQLPIDPASGKLTSTGRQIFSHDPKNANTISANTTTFVWEDPQGNIWAGTRGGGLNKINPKIPYGAEGSVVRYHHSSDDPASLSNNVVWNFYPEGETSLWVITDTGVDLFQNKRFEHVFTDKGTPTSMFKTSDSALIVGSTNGLYEGRIANAGYRFRKYPFSKITEVTRLHTDRRGRIWISNTTGIFCYDEETLQQFTKNDGFDHAGAFQPFYLNHTTSKGLFAISDRDGISLFDPLAFKANRTKTSPVFVSLKLNNRYPSIRQNGNATTDYSIKKHITFLNELTVDHDHNNFALEFSAMEMTFPNKNLYRYKLDGYDKDWIETDAKNRTAIYTNLDAGKYIFRLKAINHHGIWSEQEKQLTIRILPPPWRTWWAYSLYGLVFLGLLLGWRRYENNRLKLKHRAEHLTELDNLKTRFFANISHEFRTPITLILGPLKDLYDRSPKGNIKTILGPALKNAQRLLGLINQLLDLSKIEAGKMRLHASPVNVVQFLKEITSSYESLAATKDIDFVFSSEPYELVAYIDQEKLEKVVHNLLSNAFKFTRAGGEVMLHLKADSANAIISVKDTGTGIPADELDKVFDRFYQVDSSQTRAFEGTGLGMALAKELVELHKGKISVHSIEGKGTTFTVTLRLGSEHLNEGEIDQVAHCVEKKTLSNIVVSAEHDSKTDQPASPADAPLVLIVEDNPDMRGFLRRTLSEYYQILEAENGFAGLEIAQQHMPDLIISDIMMPEMDGVKMCSLLKNHELTSHVPVILLTAKADRESKLSGLETGADDYLAKPFDADELKLIVRNRIQERRKMRERFRREITLEPKQISITSLDEKFIINVLLIVEAHMDDEYFTIDQLSHEAGFSNTHFYRKIKALSGQTPSQFLRTIRLKRAAQLLENNTDHISQIAYSVGFGSISYFDKCFKEQFGVTPRDYAKRTHPQKDRR